jgi:hypothetical protein
VKKIAAVAVAALALTVTGCAGSATGGGADQYLDAVCPSEQALSEYQAALDAQDLAEATTNAGELATALEKTISTLGSSGTTWAEGIDPADISTLHDSYEHDLEKLQALAAPGTIGDKPFIFDYPGSDEATWRIHKTFDLPKTLTEACSTQGS